jgi:hypothetical protein
VFTQTPLALKGPQSVNQNTARPQWTSKLWSKASSSQEGRGQEGLKTEEYKKNPNRNQTPKPPPPQNSGDNHQTRPRKRALEHSKKTTPTRKDRE